MPGPDRRFHMGVAQTQQGSYPMALRQGDIVSGFIQAEGFWEMNHPQLLASLGNGVLPRRGTFVDIGSNLGWYSFLFAHFNFSVVAFEASPSNIRAMEHTACANPALAARITLVRGALGAPGAPQPCFVWSDANNAGNGQLHCGAEAAKICETRARDPDALHRHKLWGPCEPVTMQTLDSVLPRLGDLGPVVAVKADVEGAECDVLRGGQALFALSRPSFVMLEGSNATVAACGLTEAGRHGYAIGSERGHDSNFVLVDTPLMVSEAVWRRACPPGCRAYHTPGFKYACRFGPPGTRCFKFPKGGTTERPAHIVGEHPPSECDASRLFRAVI